MSVGGIGGTGGLFGLWSPGAKSSNADASAQASLSAAPGNSVRDEFQKWAEMTPAQPMRANMLESMGVTEDELKAMDADKRKAIEDRIAQMIKEKLTGDPKTRDQTGLLADIRA